MIEVRNVMKEFDGFRALDDMSMTVPTGAVYGLVGPNGAGAREIQQENILKREDNKDKIGIKSGGGSQFC